MLAIKTIQGGDFQIYLVKMYELMKNAEVKTNSNKREICDYYTPLKIVIF